MQRIGFRLTVTDDDELFGSLFAGIISVFHHLPQCISDIAFRTGSFDLEVMPCADRFNHKPMKAAIGILDYIIKNIVNGATTELRKRSKRIVL
ncbi:hypothetical protein HYN43_002640 [Mucilaginibacter celer]|uniref:Uncharacterized protein n=1 Tax=Mucilaginibacter celer TaxID=2305508 RepID=A0A494VHN0_9SPHI|nr:hypothetical protein HYN43_002640 [Mucilaginibacter celer]